MYCSKCGKSYQAVDSKSCPYCTKKETTPVRDNFGTYRERNFIKFSQLIQADLPLRLAAMMIDIIILVIPFSVLIYFAKGFGIFLDIVFGWAYYALLESSPLKGSIGKFALKLEVTDLEGKPINLLQATERYFAHYLSILTFGVGFIILALTDKKQAVHDLLTGCMVLDVVQQNRSAISRMMEE